MATTQSSEDERLGLLYEVSVNQTEAAQTALKEFAAAIGKLNALPANVCTEVSRLLASTATDAAEPARKIADQAANDFLDVATKAATVVGKASKRADDASRGVAWWMMGAIFMVGLAVGSGSLWFAYKPEVKVFLDLGKGKGGEVRACTVAAH